VDHRNFDYVNNGVVRRHAHNDTEDGRFVIASEMECDQLIRENRALREQPSQKGDFRLAARIPMPIVEKMMLDGSFHDEDAWKRVLNNPEYRDFRVWEGRV
jgi:hypothetical protein